MSGTESLDMHGATSARAAAPMSRTRFLVAVGACLAGLAILLNLGLWQVDRLHWKQAILETIDARIHADPLPIEEIARIAAETGDVEYMPATVTGRFVHSGERHFLSTLDGAAGWNVYTPLLIEGTGDAVFVNRGFVPYALKAPSSRPAGQVEGTVTVTGLARNAPAEKPGAFLPDNDPAENAFFWKSIPDMTAGLELPQGTQVLPFLVDAGAGAPPGGYPVGGVTVIDIPNSHLQYAITWFGLAAVLAIMLGMLLWGRARSRA